MCSQRPQAPQRKTSNIPISAISTPISIAISVGCSILLRYFPSGASDSSRNFPRLSVTADFRGPCSPARARQSRPVCVRACVAHAHNSRPGRRPPHGPPRPRPELLRRSQHPRRIVPGRRPPTALPSAPPRRPATIHGRPRAGRPRSCGVARATVGLVRPPATTDADLPTLHPRRWDGPPPPRSSDDEHHPLIGRSVTSEHPPSIERSVATRRPPQIDGSGDDERPPQICGSVGLGTSREIDGSGTETDGAEDRRIDGSGTETDGAEDPRSRGPADEDVTGPLLGCFGPDTRSLLGRRPKQPTRPVPAGRVGR